MHATSITPEPAHGQVTAKWSRLYHQQLHAQSRRVDTKKMPTIVVADDDSALRNLVTEQLHKDGCEVVQAWDGESLLNYVRYCEKRRQYPEMLITDLHMPTYSGLQILQCLQLRHWSIPIIVITSFGDEQAIEQGIQLGACAVLHKPFDLNVLRRTVHRCLRHAPLATQEKSSYRQNHKNAYSI